MGSTWSISFHREKNRINVVQDTASPQVEKSCNTWDQRGPYRSIETKCHRTHGQEATETSAARPKEVSPFEGAKEGGRSSHCLARSGCNPPQFRHQAGCGCHVAARWGSSRLLVGNSKEPGAQLLFKPLAELGRRPGGEECQDPCLRAARWDSCQKLGRVPPNDS